METQTAVQLAVSVAVMVYLVVIALLLVRRFSDAPLLRRVANLLFPLSQIVVVAFLLACAVYFELPWWLFGLTAVLGVACGPVDFVLFKALAEAEEQDAARERVRLLEEQLEAQKQYRARLEQDAEQAWEVRRAVVSELDEVDEALARQQAEEASAGLLRAVGLMDSTTHRFCAHRVVDALVTMKERSCKEAGVRANISLDLPDDLPISGVELCAVFSNLLDNALASCEQVAACDSARERWLSLEAYLRGSYLVVLLRNACVEQSRGERALRRGRGLSLHGWGLSIVRGIAERRGGSLEVERNGGEFVTRVVLGLDAALGGAGVGSAVAPGEVGAAASGPRGAVSSSDGAA